MPAIPRGIQAQARELDSDFEKPDSVLIDRRLAPCRFLRSGPILQHHLHLFPDEPGEERPGSAVPVRSTVTLFPLWLIWGGLASPRPG